MTMNLNSHAHNSTVVESLNVGSGGAHLLVAIPVEKGQHWSMATNAGWIHVVGKRSGVGPEVVMFDVQPNRRPAARTGSLLDSPIISIDSDLWGRTCIDQVYTRPKFRFEIHQDAAVG